MDKSRQQFEEWFNDEYETTMKDYDEPLIEFVMKQLFIVWQASRESLINNLEPVGYIMESSFDNIKEYGYTHLNEERSEKINIPLYKLD
ncbi:MULTISPECIES: hypothetical protein [Proteus]|uniref:hypothetical protein n=1 Tax=Proteus TaxID=583 RepID=UPI001A27F0C8|nr:MULTISPECIES: hypothetical protein [Proteus]MCT8233211.1 hypothetical protein [Proteus mirabilis]HAT5559528.1 hypothetical protein [Proteus mirabilis]HAT5573579.1 hypothetical protein [Proteus mirabilis]